jgi:hypothetical protein
MAVLGEKLGGRPADHSAGLEVVSGDFFLGSSRVRPMLLLACKRLPHTWTVRRKRMQDVRELTWEVYVSRISGFLLSGALYRTCIKLESIFSLLNCMLLKF